MRAFRPPATGVLVVGLIATAAVALLPPLRVYREGWVGLLVFTLICFVLLAVSQALQPTVVSAPRVRDPDLDTVIRLRREMSHRVAELPPDSYAASGMPDILARLDREIIPSLTTLCGRRQALGRRLADYESGRSGTVRPDGATLNRLRALHERQNGAVKEVVQQVVNMDASLLGLSEETDETQVAEQVRDWAQEIELRWQSLSEVLGAEEPGARRPSRSASV
jgi:hypothetical protein